MEPGTVVTDDEFLSALLVSPVLVVLLAVGDYGVLPAAGAVGFVLGPPVVYVKNVLIDDEYRRTAFLLLIVGLAFLPAFGGYLGALLWALLGYNVSTGAVGLFERRVRPLVAAE